MYPLYFHPRDNDSDDLADDPRDGNLADGSNDEPRDNNLADDPIYAVHLAVYLVLALGEILP